MTTQLPFFPILEATNKGFLNVGDGHSIYFEEAGNPQGIPVVHVHGGPGDSSSSKNYKYYDGKKYRIIMFDQRGCGKSTPSKCVDNNTTKHLIADMEALRKHLNVSKWVVSGASWGSTLALLYAQTYPDLVMGLLLRGIFLAEKEGVHWVHGTNGAAKVFPEAYERYLGFLPADMRNDPLTSYLNLILGNDVDVAKHAAVSMLNWEGVLCGMEANNKADAAERALAQKAMTKAEREAVKQEFDDFAYGHCLLESHYTANNFFIEEGQILANVDKIKHIPASIIHGRYDMICRAEGAVRLHNAYGNSRLVIVPDAGHSTSECAQNVLQSTINMANLFV